MSLSDFGGRVPARQLFIFTLLFSFPVIKSPSASMRTPHPFFVMTVDLLAGHIYQSVSALSFQHTWLHFHSFVDFGGSPHQLPPSFSSYLSNRLVLLGHLPPFPPSSTLVCLEEPACSKSTSFNFSPLLQCEPFRRGNRMVPLPFSSSLRCICVAWARAHCRFLNNIDPRRFGETFP